MKRVASLGAVAAAVTVVVGLATPARAQTPKAPAPAKVQSPPADDEPHREGVYGGVNPTAPADASQHRLAGATAQKTLHWIGFQAAGGSTQIFLQAAQPFTVDQTVDGGSLVVSITGLTKLGKNVRRPIDTRYFDGPVTRITTKARRAQRKHKGHPAVAAGVDVVITFRDGPATAGDLRTATEADGMYYAYLGFTGGGPGTAPPTVESPPPPPAPAPAPP